MFPTFTQVIAEMIADVTLGLAGLRLPRPLSRRARR